MTARRSNDSYRGRRNDSRRSDSRRSSYGSTSRRSRSSRLDSGYSSFSRSTYSRDAYSQDTEVFLNDTQEKYNDYMEETSNYVPVTGLSIDTDSIYDQAGGAAFGRDRYKSEADIFAEKKAQENKPKKKGNGKKIALGFFIAILVIIAAAVVAIFLYIKSISSNLDTIDEATAEVLEPASAMGEPYYVLILGSDSRDSDYDPGRSDTIILARVDEASKMVTLISIPRDTYVYIPDYGYDKINAAYSIGGATSTIQTVNEFAGISISHVVEVDFSGLEDIVDAVGGVTVDVPANTYYDGISVPEGVQTLNGQQALVFARCRKTYITGDYQRAENQRQLIKALAKEVLALDTKEMPKMIKSVVNCVSTDMSVTDIVSLALSMRGMDTDAIYSAVVPSYTSDIDGISYVIADDYAWDEMMERVEAGEDPNVEEDGEGTEGAEDTTGSEEYGAEQDYYGAEEDYSSGY